MINYETVKMSPVIIEIFNETVEDIAFTQQACRFGIDMRNYPDFIFLEQYKGLYEVIHTLIRNDIIFKNPEKREIILFQLGKTMFKNDP